MCLFWRYRKTRPASYSELSTERILSLLAELHSLGTKHIHFTGGEPTLRRDLVDVVRQAKSYGFKVSMNTNGTLMSKVLAKKLIETNIDCVTFSVDAPNPGLHDKIRGVQGAWSRTVEGIKSMHEAKKMKKAKTEIKVNTVIMKSNYSVVHKILDLKEKAGYDHITFSPVVLYEGSIFGADKSEEGVRPSLDEILLFNREVAPKILMKAIDDGYKVNLNRLAYPFGKKREDAIEYLLHGRPRDLYENTYCFVPWFHATILPNGDVAPCCVAPLSEDFFMGNLKDQSFEEIWEGKKFMAFRRKCQPPAFKACKLACPIDFQEKNKRIMEVFQKRVDPTFIAGFVLRRAIMFLTKQINDVFM